MIGKQMFWVKAVKPVVEKPFLDGREKDGREKLERIVSAKSSKFALLQLIKSVFRRPSNTIKACRSIYLEFFNKVLSAY
ncbi:hypothetical protein BWD10_01885 [Neisseria zoodegmatis]|uniref:Uncharacterized protein n=1 Tax=Neisseria zoodegmatis TaxID=326523 RepID=A0ABX3WGB5_9NEIS|nr:hypothetical protein BWD10_01885 [Neisseria zoodegmatis]